MDRIDEDILRCLNQNARMKVSAIAERVNLSVPAVTERIRKLEASGVILRYAMMVDGAKLGMGLVAFISVSLERPESTAEFIKLINATPSILECHYVTGDKDYLLKVQVSGSGELERIIRSLKQIRGISTTETLVVLSTVKDEISVIPRSAEE